MPVYNHAIVKAVNDVTAPFLKQKRKYGMDQANRCTYGHIASEGQRVAHVLQISFVNTA